MRPHRTAERRRTDAWADDPDEPTFDAEAWFLAYVGLFILKRLIDPENPADRARIRSAHQKVLEGRYDAALLEDFQSR